MGGGGQSLKKSRARTWQTEAWREEGGGGSPREAWESEEEMWQSQRRKPEQKEEGHCVVCSGNQENATRNWL